MAWILALWMLLLLALANPASAQFRLSILIRPRPPASAPPIVPPASLDAVNRQLLELHNDARRQRGLPPLVLDPRLIIDAQHSAQVQFERGRMGHLTLLRLGAENVAWGYRDEAEVTAGWLRSRGHRANILGPYTRVGFGRAGAYWAARFAP